MRHTSLQPLVLFQPVVLFGLSESLGCDASEGLLQPRLGDLPAAFLKEILKAGLKNPQLPLCLRVAEEDGIEAIAPRSPVLPQQTCFGKSSRVVLVTAAPARVPINLDQSQSLPKDKTSQRLIGSFHFCSAVCYCG